MYPPKIRPPLADSYLGGRVRRLLVLCHALIFLCASLDSNQEPVVYIFASLDITGSLARHANGRAWIRTKNRSCIRRLLWPIELHAHLSTSLAASYKTTALTPDPSRDPDLLDLDIGNGKVGTIELLAHVQIML